MALKIVPLRVAAIASASLLGLTTAMPADAHERKSCEAEVKAYCGKLVANGDNCNPYFANDLTPTKAVDVERIRENRDAIIEAAKITGEPAEHIVAMLLTMHIRTPDRFVSAPTAGQTDSGGAERRETLPSGGPDAQERVESGGAGRQERLESGGPVAQERAGQLESGGAASQEPAGDVKARITGDNLRQTVFACSELAKGRPLPEKQVATPATPETRGTLGSGGPAAQEQLESGGATATEPLSGGATASELVSGGPDRTEMDPDEQMCRSLENIARIDHDWLRPEKTLAQIEGRAEYDEQTVKEMITASDPMGILYGAALLHEGRLAMRNAGVEHYLDIAIAATMYQWSNKERLAGKIADKETAPQPSSAGLWAYCHKDLIDDILSN